MTQEKLSKSTCEKSEYCTIFAASLKQLWKTERKRGNKLHRKRVCFNNDSMVRLNKVVKTVLFNHKTLSRNFYEYIENLILVQIEC